MTELRYPLSALLWDYVRGIGGIAICFVILVTNEWHSQLMWLFVGLTILFAIYTMTTLAKNLARFRVSEEGIECGAFRKRTIRWGDLSELALRYYPTSRSRKKGWMTLTLKTRPAAGGSGRRPSAETSLQIESTLPGFPEIAARAAHAARENKLTVDRVTADNLAAIGAA
ncbi:MAG TPA: hypothetical protein VFG64_19845 [Dongiaceae bacterium]|nr:hypothetical protein [Dongiaceae bacterium]